jgi:hypothetical protein
MSERSIGKTYEFFGTGEANDEQDQCLPKALKAIILAAMDSVNLETYTPWHINLLTAAPAEQPHS